MSIPSRLTRYLRQQDARYDSDLHRPSRSSAETARQAHVSPHQLAKSVILEDDTGHMLMAVLPADAQVELPALAELLGRRSLRLCEEAQVARLFGDCCPGAVPALGMAWGVETAVDDALVDGNAVIYMEAGDHERLLRMSREQFSALMRPARHGHFSRRHHTGPAAASPAVAAPAS
ncbi:MAG TPA: YbaK/EbsC family protein [Roseateles sp.]|nr:YbaK/EbsC family protein [Roseateles sp.]